MSKEKESSSVFNVLGFHFAVQDTPTGLLDGPALETRLDACVPNRSDALESA